MGRPRTWADTASSPSQHAHLAGVLPEPGTMDAPPITPGELLCLGSSLAFSGLFYYLYRKKARAVARIQVALSLRFSLLPTVPSPLPYTARPRALIWVHLAADCSLLHPLPMSRCPGPSRSQEIPTKPCMTHPLPASPSAPARVHAQSLLFQEAPKLQVDDDLPALVSAADGRCLPYVALEGKETLWPHSGDRGQALLLQP